MIIKKNSVDNSVISKSDSADIIEKGNKKRSLIISERLLVVLFCLVAFLIALVPELVLPLKYLVIPVVLILLLRFDSFNYLLFPLTFLDNMIGTYISSRFTLIWFYLLFLCFKLFILERRTVLSKDQIVLLMGVVLYFFGVALPVYGMNSIKMLLIVFCSSILSQDWYKKPEQLKKLQFVVIASALVSALSLAFGLAGTMDDAEMRAIGIGFKDPNYSSLVCCLGLCSSMNYKSSKYKWLRIVITILFIFGVFRSGSRTGLIVTAAILIIELLSTHGIKKKLKGIVLAVAIVLFFLFFILPRFSTILSPLILRLVITWNSFSRGDLISATADRTTIAESYLNYYKRQDIIKQLFGGNIIASPDLLTAVGCSSVTHNVYLDYLMAFGAIGGLIMLGFFIFRTIQYFVKYEVTDILEYKAVFLMKISTLMFGITLALLQVPLWWYVCLI